MRKPQKQLNFPSFITILIENKYYLFLGVIFLVTIFLRFYRFDARWGLGSDDVRDILIAREALTRQEIPLIGSFSSAGPFVFGPLFYWIIMASYIFVPFILKSPWILTALVGVCTVGVAAKIGYLLEGRKLSIILGSLVAVSPQFVNRSTMLTQHTYIGIAAFLLLLFFILFWQKKKIYYAFLVGIALGCAVNFHYQALNLMIFIPIIFFVPQLSIKKKVISSILGLIGFLIPLLPLFYWDSKQDFANIRNILDYVLIGQYRIYTPNSFKIFFFGYLPEYWSQAIGGTKVAGYFLEFSSIATMLVFLLKRKISRILLTLFIVFSLLLFVNRYYRGERFEGYMMYLAPLIFLFSALFFTKLLQFSLTFRERNKWLMHAIKTSVLLFLFFLIAISFYQNLIFITKADNNEKELKQAVVLISTYFPNQKVALFDYHWRNSTISYPLSAFLQEEGLISSDGKRIGVAVVGKGFEDRNPTIATISGRPILDLTHEKAFFEKDWTLTTQKAIYDDLETRWTKKQKLKTNFSLIDFISSKFKK